MKAIRDSNTSLVVDTLADVTHTVQLFMQSVAYHLQSIDDRIVTLQEEIDELRSGSRTSHEEKDKGVKKS